MFWQSLMKWAMSSLKNHILFFQVIFSLPFCSMFIATSYQYQELTWLWGLWIVALGSGMGVIVACLGWYFIILPMQRRRRK